MRGAAVHAVAQGARCGICGTAIGRLAESRCDAKIGEGERRGRDVQVVTQYPRAENAHGKEVTAQAGVAAEKASDGLVAIFFVHESVGRSVSGRRFWLTIPSNDVPCGRIEGYGC